MSRIISALFVATVVAASPASGGPVEEACKKLCDPLTVSRVYPECLCWVPDTEDDITCDPIDGCHKDNTISTPGYTIPTIGVVLDPTIDVVLEQIPGGVIAECASDCAGVDSIELDLGKGFAGDVSPARLPEGWSFEVVGSKVRLSGPPLDRPTRFKLDAGSAKRPEKISYQASQEGRKVLEQKNVKVTPVAPRAVIGSLQGIVEMPTEVAPGEPMRMRVLDPAALPAGGTWSLSGTVVDKEAAEERSDAEEYGPSGPVIVAFSSSGVPEVADTSVAAAFPAGKARLVRLATDIAPSIPTETVVHLTIHTDNSLTWEPPALGRPATSAEELLMAGEEGVVAGSPAMGAAKIPCCRWWRPGPPPQCRICKPPKPNPCPNDIPSCPNHPAFTFAVAAADGTVDFQLPDSLQPGSPISMQYVDKFGDVVADVPSVEGLEVVEPRGNGEARITDATPRSFAGQRVCVCGTYPGPAAWDGILLDGQPVGSPASGSGQIAWVELPAGLAPGEHVFTGRAAAGFPAADRASTLVLQVGGEIDSRKLQRLESTPMRLWVIGTEEPVDLRVRNLTPAIISIEGGDDQTIRTSGGATNQLERTVRGLAPGAFDINYELAGEPCPCERRIYVW